MRKFGDVKMRKFGNEKILVEYIESNQRPLLQQERFPGNGHCFFMPRQVNIKNLRVKYLFVSDCLKCFRPSKRGQQPEVLSAFWNKSRSTAGNTVWY
jgi:hypothetical protein